MHTIKETSLIMYLKSSYVPSMESSALEALSGLDTSYYFLHLPGL